MDRFKRYLEVADQMHGWFDVGCVKMFDAIDKAQRSLGVRGNIGEIGIYTGRSFIPLCLLAQDGERAVGIDCFSRQELNLSGSGFTPGMNDRKIFERHARSVLDDMDGIVVIEGNAYKMESRDYVNAGGGPFRIWHIDGGHDWLETNHDLNACFGCLVGKGVVIVDDVFNKEWPEVARAMYAFVGDGARVSPLAYGYGKAVLCFRNDHEVLRSALARDGRHSGFAKCCGVKALLYQ